MTPDIHPAFRYAIRLLARKGYSEKTLRAKLIRRFPEPSAVEKIIDNLKSLHYLDDLRFARALAQSRLGEQGWGPRRVAEELVLRQGIPKDLASQAIGEVLAEQPEPAICDRAVQRWRRSHGLPRTLKDRQRLYGFLLRQGFNPELVLNTLASFKIPTEDADS